MLTSEIWERRELDGVAHESLTKRLVCLDGRTLKTVLRSFHSCCRHGQGYDSLRTHCVQCFAAGLVSVVVQGHLGTESWEQVRKYTKLFGIYTGGTARPPAMWD